MAELDAKERAERDMDVAIFLLNVCASIAAAALFELAKTASQRRNLLRQLSPYSVLVGEVVIVFAVPVLLSVIVFRTTIGAAASMGLIALLALAVLHLRSVYAANTKLQTLADIMGADDWRCEIGQEGGIPEHLHAVSRTFSFMGMGFNKYVEWSGHEARTLQTVLNDCQSSHPEQRVRVLVMNPFSRQVREYQRHRLNSTGKSTTQKILESLREIDRLRGLGLPIDCRFYPSSMHACANFRMFIANGNEMWISFYRYRDEGYSVPQIHLKERGETTFFRPFAELFRYLWNAGEEADYHRLCITLEANHLTDRDTVQDLHSYLSDSLGFFFPKEAHVDLPVAVVAVAGKDSVAAIVQAAMSGKFRALVPVIVDVPTEYDPDGGDPRLDTIAGVRRFALSRFSQDRCVVLNAIRLRDSHGWAKINGKKQLELVRTLTGRHTPCVGCHLYVHALRAALARTLGIDTVISGDRRNHANILKLNQQGAVLDTIASYVYKRFGIQMVFPFRDVTDTAAIDTIIAAAAPYIGSIHDFTCYFSGTGSVSEVGVQEIKQWTAYIKDHAIPQFDNFVGIQ